MPFNADTLRALVFEIRSLSARRDSPAERLEAAGRLLIAAIDAGAFAAPGFAPFIVGVRQRREQEKVNGWISAWVKAVWWLKGKPDAPPDPDGKFAADCELVAAQILESARPADPAGDAPIGGAEQARAFPACAQCEIHDGVFLRGAVGELKQRVARLPFALARPASNAALTDSDPAGRLWRFYSSVDPRQQPVGHRLFLESFAGGEPTDRTLRDLHRCEMLSVGPPSSVDMRSWEHAVGTGFAGPAAVAELLAAVRGVASMGAAHTRPEPDPSTEPALPIVTPAHIPTRGSESNMKRWVWDLHPLSRNSWGNLQYPDDGTAPGQTIELRRAKGMLNGDYAVVDLLPGESRPSMKMGTFTRRFYVPTEADLEIVRTKYPDNSDPAAPPWPRIEADLIAAGQLRDELVKLNAPTLLQLLAVAGSKATAKRPGHKPDTDPKADAKLAEAWKEGADAFTAAFEPVVKAVFEAKAASEGLVVPDKTPAAPNAPTYSVAALRDMTGLGNNALNRYAKTANVTTPRRGERDFKYTLADVRAILESIIASTAEDKLRDRCKSALRNLPEIAE